MLILFYVQLWPKQQRILAVLIQSCHFDVLEKTSDGFTKRLAVSFISLKQINRQCYFGLLGGVFYKDTEHKMFGEALDGEGLGEDALLLAFLTGLSGWWKKNITLSV